MISWDLLSLLCFAAGKSSRRPATFLSKIQLAIRSVGFRSVGFLGPLEQKRFSIMHIFAFFCMLKADFDIKCFKLF